VHGIAASGWLANHFEESVEKWTIYTHITVLFQTVSAANRIVQIAAQYCLVHMEDGLHRSSDIVPHSRTKYLSELMAHNAPCSDTFIGFRLRPVSVDTSGSYGTEFAKNKSHNAASQPGP
jgi:hypothetical protein